MDQLPAPKLLTDSQQQSIFEDLDLGDISEEKKAQLLNVMIDTLMNRIFNRILPALTEQDINMIQDLELRPQPEVEINNYLMGKIPNLNTIINEEVTSFREELKQNVKDINKILAEQK